MNRQLQELADIHYGKSPASIRAESSDIPIYATSGQVGWAMQALFDGPLTVVARKGTLGNPTYSAGPCWVIDTAYAVIPKQNVDGKWLYYALSSYNLGSLNEATGVPSISRDYLYRVTLNTPDYPEQRKIARILSTVDDLIERTEALIAKHRAIKQGLMHDLLTRGVDASGRLRPPRGEAPGLYRESAVGWVPREWEVVRLGELFEVKGGKRLPTGHDYADVRTNFRYLRVTDFFQRDINFDELESLQPYTFDALQHYEILPDNLFISIAGSLGHVGVFRPPDFPSTRTILTENAARLAPIDRTLPEFIALMMNSEVVQKQINAEIGTGGGVPKLALFRIERLLLPLPNLQEQIAASERIAAMGQLILKEVEYLHKLGGEKSGLMQDLLTGRVRCLDRGGAK